MLLYRNLKISLNSVDETRFPAMIERRLKVRPGSVKDVQIVKKSIDARRGRMPRFVYSLALEVDQNLEEKLLSRDRPVVEAYEPPRFDTPFDAASERRPVIVGAGPAGLFTAHRLASAGLRPIVLERGPEVTERSLRWHSFLTGGEFDPDSNLLFGEGGAGAYSDGKLYTRVSDSRCREVLEILAEHGAPAEILYDAKPHIGSNLLPSIIRRMRKALIEMGAEFRFLTTMTGLLTNDNQQICGVEIEPGGVLETDAVFLGTGHSAREVYRMLDSLNVAMEPKAFQMGVRVEHPQKLINEFQYGEAAGHPALPAAEYQLIAKRKDGDLFSFCMCPGGEVLPAMEQEGFVCVNGASKYRRRSPYANSGFVVTVSPEHFPDSDDALAGLRLQEQVEAGAAAAAGQPFAAPALRMTDFMAGRVSESLPECSYPLPLVPASFDFLPEVVLEALKEGFPILNRRLPGFISDEAIVVAPESRSSSPVRILRDRETCESLSHPGLYPMGEGAGFAGGIVSAAVDGMRCAEVWCRSLRGAR